MVKFVATGKEYDADEIGVLKLGPEPRQITCQPVMLATSSQESKPPGR